MSVPRKVALAPVAPSVDSSVKAILETLTGQRRGAKFDAAITWRDFIDLGVIKLAGAAAAYGPGIAYVNPGQLDFTRPPAITGLAASGAFAAVVLNWDQSAFSNYAYTEIWRSIVDDFGQAVKVGNSVPNVYADYVGSYGTFYYWVRAVSTANVAGPINAVAGTVGETAQDPAYVLQVLAGAVTETELYAALSTRIDLIDAPDTTAGSVNARVKTETDARTTADTALAYAINTLSSSVGDNTSAIQTEQTTRADADTAIAGDVSTLQTTVGGHTASIQTHATSIDGIHAQYTVKIDNNGHVAGYGLASTTSDEGQVTSDFIVLADRFSISLPAHPWQATTAVTLGYYNKPSVANGFVYECTVAGTTAGTEPVWPVILGNTVVDGTVTWKAVSLQELIPFIVGIVNGVKTVAINGTLFVDDAIEARMIKAGEIAADHISVTDLAAISANLGSITGGSLNINNQFIVDSAGTVTANAGTFSGTLSAASGTFSGSLTASAVNAVDTINLAGQSVTIPVSSFTNTIVNPMAEQVWVAVQTCTIVSTGAPIDVIAQVLTGSGDSTLVRVVRGGVVVYGHISITSNGHQITVALSDTTTAGSHTYELQLYVATGANAWYSNSYMRLLETKR